MRGGGISGGSCLSFQGAEEFFEGEAVEDVGLGEAGAAGLVDARGEEIEFGDAVGVGVDRDFQAGVAGEAGVFDAEVEAVGAGVYFEKAAALAGVFDHAVDIDFVAGAAEEQAAGGVAEDVAVGVVHRAEEALGLLRFVEGEARVDGADGVVELGEEVVGVIERAVGEDVDFGGFEDAEVGEARVEFVDGADLRAEIGDADPAGDLERLRVVGDAEVGVAAFARGDGELLNRVRAVAGGGVAVKLAADVGERDERREFFGGLRGAGDLVVAFAELGLDVGEAEGAVGGFLGGEGGARPGEFGEAARSEFFEVGFGAGGEEEREAPFCGGSVLDGEKEAGGEFEGGAGGVGAENRGAAAEVF